MQRRSTSTVLAVLALAPAGAGARAASEVWIDRFDGLAHGNDDGEAVAADAAGDVV